jgi:Na+/proline symporter
MGMDTVMVSEVFIFHLVQSSFLRPTSLLSSLTSGFFFIPHIYVRITGVFCCYIVAEKEGEINSFLVGFIWGGANRMRVPVTPGGEVPPAG